MFVFQGFHGCASLDLYNGLHVSSHYNLFASHNKSFSTFPLPLPDMNTL
jgi:hypothetical protein